MNGKTLTSIILIICFASMTAITGCEKKDSKGTKATSENSSGMTNSGGGITWNRPEGWESGPMKTMRLATYIVNPIGVDTDSAECAVFYFGPQSGGGTIENIHRWAGQFEQSDGSHSMENIAINSINVNDIKTTTVDLAGTYLVSGPMMQVQGKKEGYRLLGAIVEGPEGSVFFKMTGPQNTMEQSRQKFIGMIESIKAGDY